LAQGEPVARIVPQACKIRLHGFEDETEARPFGDNDPSVIGGLNRFEIHPMRVAASRATGVNR
jgi:antitoxin (DNA-binding transcriptional repressor) of toxin-antitoxin stability system